MHKARISNEDHRRMLHHIRRRDADPGEQLVREHIRRGREMALKILDRDTLEKPSQNR
jgi:DNA-binding GntR family transcriptional regulator